jgi:F-type H+-transporting ATPase subunit a
MFLRLFTLFFAAAVMPFTSLMASETPEPTHHEVTEVHAATEQAHTEEAGEGHETAHGHGAAEEDAPFNPNDMIMHHIADSHGWHILDWNGHAVSIPLPVILWTREGLVVFSSGEFHHDIEGHHVVEAGGQQFVNKHDKIYYAGTDEKPVDLSITKNVLALLVGAVVLLLIFFSAARYYAKNGNSAPRGLASFVEPLILFVRDDIARGAIPEKHLNRFVPYLLTLFFFIWVNNLLGLVPFFPGGANLTGNIAVTMVLAAFTLIITNVNGTKDYWMHIVWMPGVPAWLKPILALIELVGVFTKPFSLMIRLFANITAGHILVLSLVSLIFIFESVWVSPGSIILTLFISTLELLVAALQAYVFTMLTAMSFGAAVEEHHHDDHAHAEGHH